MNHVTKTTVLPDLTANLLLEGGCLIDNLFADLWKHMGMKAGLNRIGFHKRSGTAAHELVYCLMIWVWLRLDSVGMFARVSPCELSPSLKRRPVCGFESGRLELGALRFR